MEDRGEREVCVGVAGVVMRVVLFSIVSEQRKMIVVICCGGKWSFFECE